MKICGIVAEYNPFHNGHKYQIEEIKNKHGYDAVIAVMSGNFLQRGIPASFDKFTRAKTAIENGVDIVIELPTCYATSSSEFFASGAISILQSLNCLDAVCFGASTDDLDILENIASILINEPEDYKFYLQKELKKGISYPKARSNSLCNYLSNKYSKEILENILPDPNNILGIEYIKALKSLHSQIKPIAIKRIGTTYNSQEFDYDCYICSSTAIREKLKNSEIDFIKDFLPESSYKTIYDNYSLGKVQMEINDFEKEILLTLRKMTNYEIAQIADVNEGLENVIQKALLKAYDIDTLIDEIKSKRYTLTRIQRILIHSLFNIKTAYLSKYKFNPQYARVLAVSKNGKKVLSEIAKKSSIPVITNVAKFIKDANDEQKEMLELDILATNTYTLGYKIPQYRKFNLDYTEPIITF